MKCAVLIPICLCVTVLSACSRQEPPQTRSVEASETREPNLVRQAASRFGLDLYTLPKITPRIASPYLHALEQQHLKFHQQNTGRRVFVVGANLVPFFGSFDQYVYAAPLEFNTPNDLAQKMDSHMQDLGAIKLNSSEIPTQKYNDLDQNFSSQIIQGEVHTYGFRLNDDDAVLIQMAIGDEIEYLVMQINVHSPNGQGEFIPSSDNTIPPTP